MSPAVAKKSKKDDTKDLLYPARPEEFAQLCKLRRTGLTELYSSELKPEGVEALMAATTQTKIFESCLENGTVFKIHDPHTNNLEGFFHTKFQVIQGNNGICKLHSFCVNSEALISDYFPYQLSAIEQCIQKAGCYRIKGVASEKEFSLIEPFDYSVSAPRYRHTFGGVTLTFVPFCKTLYHPKL